MKRVICNEVIEKDAWDFDLDTDSTLLPAGPRFAWSGLFGFDGVLISNLHEITDVEHMSKLCSNSRRSDAYIASGPAYFDADKQQGDIVYAVAAVRSDLYPTRVYKFYNYQEALKKADQLLRLNKHEA